MLKNARSSYRQPMDLPVHVDVKGIRLPINATIVDVSVTGCRLRSWIALERGANLTFTWPREGVRLFLSGAVAERRASSKGEAFEYGIVFTGMPAAQTDELAKEILEAQRREAFNRTQREHETHVNPSESNRRSAYRAHVRFPVEVTFVERPAAPLQACAVDVGAGGLRIACDRDLQPNDEIVLRFRMPAEVLRVFPAQIREEIVETPFGPRMRTKNSRKPFEEMRIRSRVAARLERDGGPCEFGIAFVEIDAYTREEIARFIHAVQLGELRERSRRR